MELLLKNAAIVTVDKERRVIFDGAMAVDKGRIAAVGKNEEVLSRYPDADQVLDLKGKAVFPGFVNTHTHLFQSLMKGLGDDMLLKDWLGGMMMPCAQYLNEDDCYYGAMLGTIDSIRSGVTTQLDYMHTHASEGLSDPIIKALGDLGVRGIFAYGYMSAGQEFGTLPALCRSEDYVEKELIRLIETYHNTNDGKMQVWAAPSALWSNTPEMLRRTYELVTSYGTGFTAHTSETMFNREASEAVHGCAGTDLLEKYGITGPNVLLVHCVYLNEKDIQSAKEHDYKISHNPVCNMYMASGAAPVPEMLDAGLAVGLGLDGAASNNGQDILETMKTTALLHKVHHLDNMVITAEKVLEMATIGGARCVGMENEIGSLEEGKKADFVVFNPFRSAKAVPMHNPVSTLVYSSCPENIESVAVDGKFILFEGKLTTVPDETAVLEKADACARALCDRAGVTNRGEGHTWRG